MLLTRNPFLKLIVPLIAGIMLQWYLQLPVIASGILLSFSVLVFICFSRFSAFHRFRHGWMTGLCINLCVISLGLLLVIIKEARHQKNGLGSHYKSGETLVASILETPVAKQRSYKAAAKISFAITGHLKQKRTGGIVIYFIKDSSVTQLKPGDQIVFNKALQEIKNTNNPGGFNYKRYALFNGLTHQVYLTVADFQKIPGNNASVLQTWLYESKRYVLKTIKQYIKGKKEQGLAEAMLIGYKDDLDKSLLQSYSNTGVVHVIAVSGMHLALLYYVLDLLFLPLLKNRRTRWLHPLLVLFILWGFTLITGGAASIVRAAVMFTFIMIGKSLNRNASIYNTLAVSAFCLLCYNPFWLWDVGFQLSYAAVLGIVIFYKPVYDLVFVKNKMLDNAWQLIAVSLAAQILTTPFTIYYFHQFPVYFLLANLIVVPVSTIVLMGTLLLIIVSPIKILGSLLGHALNGSIWWLNTFIERMEDFPFSVWSGLQINLMQAILLIIIITGAGFWLIEKMKAGVWVALAATLLFLGLRSYSFLQAGQQQKIIVYNIPKSRAVDFVEGRNYYFMGDSTIRADASLQNFHLKPSRIQQRLVLNDLPADLYRCGNAVQFGNKKVLFVNGTVTKRDISTKSEADLVILSGNPRLYMASFLQSVQSQQIVIDGSVPAWKARYWQRDCDSLHIPCYNVANEGAFVMNLR